jgi:hypothetical protein
MIPKNISKDHIINAIKMVEKFGIPSGHESVKFNLLYEGKTYPPKYVIALANQIANREILKSSEFNGGLETNSFLERLGFKISNKNSELKEITKSPAAIVPKAHHNKSHNERCPDCKQTLEKMLTKIYTSVIPNYKFESGVFPEDFIKSEYYQVLKEIFSSLKGYRGHHSFIRTLELPRVDFYVPNPGLIIEFDESQHFTQCRKVALLKYPKTLKIGFDLNKWIELCSKINANDRNPPFRDEQRAWYDTLRDFLPTIKQLEPTIRLYSKDYHWCSLNPEIESDVNKFRKLLNDKRPSSEIEIIEDPNPTLARIVIKGDWEGEINTAKSILHQICDNWPQNKKVDCLITCGAFLSFDWPQPLTDVGNNKYPSKESLDLLTDLAIKHCKLLIDEDLRKRLSKCTDYLTIGIDSYKSKISLSNVSIRQLHVEMVTLLDLKTNKYFLTGKSYPTPGQENGLVRFQDLKTHFVDLTIGKVLILGCHDLNVFSPRGKVTTKKEWRKQIRESLYSLIQKENPTIVLHHPHTTDSSRIWTPSWNELIRVAPNIERFISAGRYFNTNSTRSRIEDVLLKTKLANTIDFIVNN